MKRRFAVLTVLGALLALAVPASSSAAMYPAGAKFEIGTTPQAYPALTTSLGSCYVKITGQVPKAPENEGGVFPVTPTVASCSSGLSATLAGEWIVAAVGFTFTIATGNKTDAVVIRSSTLPGCKLTSTGSTVGLQGLFLNGTTTPKLMQSGYHAHGLGQVLTWANDGGTCAIAGSKETVGWGSGTGITTNSVKNLTTPSTPIIVTN